MSNADVIAVVSSLSTLLESSPEADGAAWLSSDAGVWADTEDAPGGEGAPPAAAFASVTASVARWTSATKLLPADESTTSASALWDALATALGATWPRALLSVVARASSRFCAEPPTVDTVRGEAARAALEAACAYWELLVLPGAAAFGLVHAAVSRRSFAAAKRWLEMAVASASDGDESTARVVRAVSKVQVRIAPEGIRRNPRRGAADTAAPTAAEKDEADDMNDDVDENSGNDDYDDDDDDEDDDGGAGGDAQRRKRRPRAAAKAAKRGRRGGAESGETSSRLVFSSSAVQTTHKLLGALAKFLERFSLRASQEFIPLAAEMLLLPTFAPAHVVSTRSPTVADAESARGDNPAAAAHLLVVAGRGLLALLHERHASPLTTSRIVLKRLKTPLLGEREGISSSTAPGGAPAPIDADDINAAADAAAAAGLIGAPLAPPDSRTLRARALYLTRVLIADDIRGGVTSAAAARLGAGDGGGGGQGADALPATVLARLPAVAALLQHISAGSAGAKNDARAAAADTVAALRACLPHSLRRATLRFVAGALSASARVPLRQMAVDIAAACLALESSGGGQDGDGGIVRATALAEMATPTATERAFESGGYGQEGADYAGDASRVVLATTDAGTDGVDALRTSISVMGAKNGELVTGLPADDTSNEGAPQADRFGGASPFYGTPSTSERAVDKPDGCVDPRPTVLILLDVLVQRTSDKSPAVRARAMAAIGAALDSDACAHSRIFCALLGTLALNAEESVVRAAREAASTDAPALRARSTLALLTAAGAAAAVKRSAAMMGPHPLVPLLLRRLGDAKPAVRKSAAAALGALGASGGADIPTTTFFDATSPWAARASICAALVSAAMTAQPPRGSDASALAASPPTVLGPQGLRALCNAATDASSLVRRASAGAVSRLFTAAPSVRALRAAFLSSVVPLVRDNEASVSTRALEAIRSVIVEVLVAPANTVTDERVASVWRVLASAGADEDLTRCLSTAMNALARAPAGLPTRRLVGALQQAAEIASTEGASAPSAAAAGDADEVDDAPLSPLLAQRGAWVLLEALAGVERSTDVFTPLAPFVISSWARADAALTAAHGVRAPTELPLRVLRVLASLAPILAPAAANKLVDTLSARLGGFTLAPPLIAAAVRAAAALSVAGVGGSKLNSSQLDAAVHGWAAPLLASAVANLERAVVGGTLPRPEALCQLLFTAGELALLGLDGEGAQGVRDGSAGFGGGTSDAARLTPLLIPASLSTLAQALLAPALDGGSGARVPDAARAHAYAILGKLSLRTPALAKALIPVLVRDLSARGTSEDGMRAPPAVRNNILFVLSDVCVRYTSLVETHAASVAGAIADPAPAVRRTALVLLTQLVSADYLKWRDFFFFRFARSLADPSPPVAALAAAALAGPLAARNRTTALAHFVDLVFALTGTAPRTPAASFASEGATAGVVDDDASTTLVLPSGTARAAVYSRLLEALPEEAIFTITGKLVNDILGSALDGSLGLAPRGAPRPSSLYTAANILEPLPATEGCAAAPPFLRGSSEALVSEVLFILCSARFRIGARGGSGGATAADDDADADVPTDEGGGGVAVSLAAAKSRLIGKLARKAVVENVLPICIALKKLLSARASPLLGPLMTYLAVLFADYGSDVKGDYPPPQPCPRSSRQHKITHTHLSSIQPRRLPPGRPPHSD